MADIQRFSESAETPQLRFYPNGPILVRGAVELLAADGTPIPQRRRVVALCRCGHSALNPLCDGTHKLVRRFRPDRREPPASAIEPDGDGNGARAGIA